MKKLGIFCVTIALVFIGWGQASADLWTYEYELETYAQANPIHNLLIELTNNTDVGNILYSSVPSATHSTGTFTSALLTGLPASTYGIDFALPYAAGAHDFTIKFDSPNAPVWGNFFANDWDYSGLAYAYNNTTLNPPVYIPVPDGGGVGVPAADWVGSLTNIDGNNTGAGAWPPINADSPLYVYGDRWYYQASDMQSGGTYKDFGWVEFSWKISPSSVPESSTLLFLGFGLVGLAGFGRRKLKKS